MKHISIPAVLGGLIFFSACSSNDDVVICPPLSAPPEGARAFVKTDNQQQVVDVRLNGVSAQCRAESSGTVLMEVSAGLKLTRNLAEGAGQDVAIVPVITAIIDAGETVLSNDSFGYKNGFNTDVDRLFPVIKFDLVVPSDGRAVISLTPTR